MQEEEQRAPQPPPQVKQEVENSLDVLRLVGEIVEVYLPRFSDMLVNMLGGSQRETPPLSDPNRRKLPHDLPTNTPPAPHPDPDGLGRI